MDIADIVTTEFVEVDGDTRLGKVRPIFEQENPKGIVVTTDGEYAGVVGEKQLVRSRIEDGTRVNVLTTAAPRLDRTEDVRETARQLVEADTRIAPVYEGERLSGIVTADDILQGVIENLDAITVEQIQTEDVITIDQDARVGQAINQLRERDISRLPVLDDEELVGMVTTNDVVTFVVRDDDRQGRGDRSGDLDRMLDLPVYDLMTSPVVTATPGESVQDAVERMFDHDVSGLVVTDDDVDGPVVGIVTKTDVLRALTFTEEERMDVQITNVDLLDDVSRESIVENITEVADKYQQMQVHHAHVRLHEHKEKLRGTPLLRCEIRLRTSEGQVAGSGEGYGAEHAFHVALDKLERNVLKLKGVKNDERYRAQLRRKLGEL